jgi:hypothetical protein
MKKTWYPIENKKAVIEMRIDSLQQLFDKRDPNPFRSKDLDEDVEEYILTCADEIGKKKLGKFRLLTLDPLNHQIIGTVKNAIYDYFHYRSAMTAKKINFTLKTGLKSLLIGSIFLTIAITFSFYVTKNMIDGYFRLYIKESLMLLGWVSMWKPVNIFLYEWWPLKEKKSLYEKLTTIEIDIVEIENSNLKSIINTHKK